MTDCTALLSTGLYALSSLNSLLPCTNAQHALPHFTNENPKPKMMESLARAYSARKWPTQIYTQLLTNCTEIVWALYTLGARERALPGVQRSEFTDSEFTGSEFNDFTTRAARKRLWVSPRRGER